MAFYCGKACDWLISRSCTMYICHKKFIVGLHVANMSVPRDYLAMVYYDIDRIFRDTIDAHNLYDVHTVAYVTVL